MKCLSIAGKYCSITTEEGKRTPIRRNGQYRNQYTLGKARQQRLAGLRRTLCSLAVPPELFITLIIPNNGRQPFDYPTYRKVFNSFTKKLKYHFKKSWFIYKCEWKENVGFHFHMLGNLFKKSISSSKSCGMRHSHQPKYVQLQTRQRPVASSHVNLPSMLAISPSLKNGVTI